jgi:RNA polymerase sigma-70 factor (ECF subfamily)
MSSQSADTETTSIISGRISNMNDELRRLKDGGINSLGELFSEYRDRLVRLVAFRLDARLRSRVDADDVLQEAYIEVSRRLDRYLEEPEVSFYVWIRQLTLQTLIDVQRRHFGQKRSPQREVQPKYNPVDETSDSIVRVISSQLSSPSRAAMRAEESRHLQDALASMDATDREVLALRHFEHLGNSEVAEALGLSATAASNRYVRAMTRLGEILRQFSGGGG